MKGACISVLLAAAVMATMVRAQTSDVVTGIHVSQWEEYRSKCNRNSNEYDPDFFPVGNLDDCNKYFKCEGNFLPMFHCPDGEDFNARLKKCDSPANAGCASSSN